MVALPSALELEERFSLFELLVDGQPIWYNCRERYGRLASGASYQRARLRTVRQVATLALRSARSLLQLRHLARPYTALAISNTLKIAVDDHGRPYQPHVAVLRDALGADAVLQFELPSLTEADRLSATRDDRVLHLDAVCLAAAAWAAWLRRAPWGPRRRVEAFLARQSFAKSHPAYATVAALMISEAANQIAFGTLIGTLGRLTSATFDVDIAGASRFLFHHTSRPTLEIQHGVIHENHPAYMFPRSARPTMRRRFARHWIVTQAPHYTSLLQEAGVLPPSQVFTVGPLTLARDTQNSAAESAGWPSRGGHGLRVLMTSQPGQYATARISEFASMLAADQRFNVVIRPHPLERGLPAPYRGLPGVTCSEDGLPTARLLQLCDVHISFNSTCLEEAYLLGKPSVVLDDNHPLWRSYVQSGRLMALTDFTPQSLLAAIHTNQIRLVAPLDYQSQLDSLRTVLNALTTQPH